MFVIGKCGIETKPYFPHSEYKLPHDSGICIVLFLSRCITLTMTDRSVFNFPVLLVPRKQYIPVERILKSDKDVNYDLQA